MSNKDGPENAFHGTLVSGTNCPCLNQRRVGETRLLRTESTVQSTMPSLIAKRSFNDGLLYRYFILKIVIDQCTYRPLVIYSEPLESTNYEGKYSQHLGRHLQADYYAISMSPNSPLYIPNLHGPTVCAEDSPRKRSAIISYIASG